MADFDPTKPVQTRDGRSARILCTDRNGGPPLLALVRDQEGEERICSYNSDGQAYASHRDGLGLDLVNIPERESVFYNVYSNAMLPCRHSTLERAGRGMWYAPHSYLCTIEIVREGGEGGVIVERKFHNLLEN